MGSRSKSGRLRILLGLSVVLITGFILTRIQKPKEETEGTQGSPHLGGIPEESKTVDRESAVSEVQKTPAASQQATSDITTKLASLRSDFFACADLKEKEALLTALKEQLIGAKNKAEVISALLALIESGENFETGLAFRPGANGDLRSWSSERLFLLDVLSLLDTRETLRISREILERSGGMDERVFALKSIAKVQGDAVLNDEQWNDSLLDLYRSVDRDTPADYALLYGLDILAFAGEAEHLQTLEDIANHASEPSYVHGSKLATTRMILNDPRGTFETLLNEPEVWSSDQTFRSSLFSLANPSDETQAKQVEKFLDGSDGNDESVDVFFSLFPNLNRSVSHNLLTQQRATSIEDAARTDLASLELVNKWISEKRYPEYESQLLNLRSKLEKFVASAEKGKKQRN